MPFIQIDNTDHYFRLRRSQRTKRLHMVVRPFGFEIVAPNKIKNRDILTFIWQHRSWMYRQAKRRSHHEPSPFAWPEAFYSGETLSFRGQPLTLEVSFHDKANAQLVGNTLKVVLPWKKIACHQVHEAVKKQVFTWYKEQTLQAIQQSLAHFCNKLGRWPKGYYLRQQKTRWGSCGIQDNIYINWLLILAPLGVLEYVVAHELCHLFHRNHGKRFWAKVQNCFPEYERYERWLKTQGHHLQSLH